MVISVKSGIKLVPVISPRRRIEVKYVPGK
jgi:hypothetical protein